MPMEIEFYIVIKYDSLGIAPTQNCTYFIKIGFVVDGVGLNSYFIHQWNKSDNERKIVRKKLSFMHSKRFNTFSKRWVQFRVGAIPCLPYEKCRQYLPLMSVGLLLICSFLTHSLQPRTF